MSTSQQALPLKHLLRNYTTEHPLRSPSPLPPSSRVDPTLTQRLPPSSSFNPFLWTLSTWWLFIRFLLTKGLHVYFNLLSHFLFGPKRKSWGYRMTFITSFMRNIADHSSLADIILIRRFISLHLLVPLPGDAVVTPITFKVPKVKKLNNTSNEGGFLQELDLKENGTRELSGEWVVGTDVWNRLKAERRVRNRLKTKDSNSNKRISSSSNPNSTPTTSSNLKNSIAPNSEDKSSSSSSSRKSNKSPSSPNSSSTIPPPNSDNSPHKSKGSTSVNSSSSPNTDSESEKIGERVIYYVHGGAYYVGNAATHRLITIGVSKSCNARVFAITYRLAPEHAFPLPLHDVLHGYLRLLAPPLSIPPENIIIAGDSAGGGLSLALCMYLRDEGYKLPAGLVLLSPWVDLTMSCGSWDENAATDVVPRPQADDHLNPVGCYLGPKGISTYVTHPYASPLFGDFKDLPPMLIQSGDSEVLRDEITLLAHKATLSGVNVTHELYEDMVHVFQMFSFLPATKAAINNIGKWVCETLPFIESEENNLNKLGKLGKEIEQEIQTSPRVVVKDGEEFNTGTGLKSPNKLNILPEELQSTQDYISLQKQQERQSRLTTPKSSALRLDIGETQPEVVNRSIDAEQEQKQIPSNDTDSLPYSTEQYERRTSTFRSRSRSITPTPQSRTPLPTDSTSTLGFNNIPFPNQSSIDRYIPHTLPRLRRAITNVPTTSNSLLSPTPKSLSPSSSSSITFTDNHNLNNGERRKRRTTHSLHVSPSNINSRGSGGIIFSNPTSPTPSIRKRLRGPSLSLSQSQNQSPSQQYLQLQLQQHSGITSSPSTRARSKSHSDIFELVEGYVECGAANTTTVIDPEGEIRSMGVLGEDEDGF